VKKVTMEASTSDTKEDEARQRAIDLGARRATFVLFVAKNAASPPKAVA
jgi:hypothetical protein